MSVIENNPDSRQHPNSVVRGRHTLFGIPMLTDLSTLLNAEIKHHYPPRRDIHGQAIDRSFTRHPARVTRATGVGIGAASGEGIPLPKATVWLINHPRQFELGQTIELDDGAMLEVVGFEARSMEAATITKVFLK